MKFCVIVRPPQAKVSLDVFRMYGAVARNRRRVRVEERQVVSNCSYFCVIE